MVAGRSVLSKTTVNTAWEKEDVGQGTDPPWREQKFDLHKLSHVGN